MNDKEFNMAILAKLYEIAEKVFTEGVTVPEGSYTASALARRHKKENIFKDAYITRGAVSKPHKTHYGCDTAPIFSVKVEAFEASFCASKIFDIVARFEKLVGFGKAKQHVFANKQGTAQDTANTEIGSVTVWLDKSMAKMANFCDKSKYPVNEKYAMVAVDFRNNKIAAANGQILNVRALRVLNVTGEIPEDIYPLVNYKEFANLCNNAGKTGTPVKFSLILESDKYFWVCEDYKAEAKKWWNYLPLFSGSFVKDKVVSLDNREWRNILTRIINHKKEEPDGFIYIHHEESSDAIHFVMQNEYEDFRIEYCAKCTNVPTEAFVLCFSIENLIKACKAFNISICRLNGYCMAIGEKCVSLIMPAYIPKDHKPYFTWAVSGEKSDVFEYCGFNDDSTQQLRTDGEETASVGNVSQTTKETPCEAVCAPENELQKPSIYQTGSNNRASRTKSRITLYSLGLRDGDTLQFVDGQTVTVCSEKKVEYEGRQYTLSGFTKTFITKSNKCGAYRGIMYFYKDGVRLDKYAKKHQSLGDTNIKQGDASIKEAGQDKNSTPAKADIQTIINRYNQLKQEIPNCLLLFRYGDTYEIYCEDAVKASPIVGIKLTQRNDNTSCSLNMVAFQHGSLNACLQKLICAGTRVVICGSPEAANSVGENQKEQPRGNADTPKEQQGNAPGGACSRATHKEPSLCDTHKQASVPRFVERGNRLSWPRIGTCFHGGNTIFVRPRFRGYIGLYGHTTPTQWLLRRAFTKLPVWAFCNPPPRK